MMKGNKPLKTITNITYPAFAVFLLACFALSPKAQAVVPAPDGGYPNGNTAEGDDSLFDLDTGFCNTPIGYAAIFRNTTGNKITAIGSAALHLNATQRNNTP